MKLKTLPLFSPEPLFSAIVCAVVGLGLRAQVASGPIESLETMIGEHRQEYLDYKKELFSSTEILTDFSQVESFHFHGLFLRSLLLHSDQGFLSLGQDDPCLFYSLLENDLLKNTEGSITGAFINVKFKDSENLTARYVSLDTLLSHIHQTTCFTNREIINLFIPLNIEKTLTALTYATPSNETECTNILQEWKSNKYTPYLCGVSKKIEAGDKAETTLSVAGETLTSEERRTLRERVSDKRRYGEKVDFFKTNYLRNLCQGISETKNFCAKYIAKDVWSGVINRGEAQYKMKFKCRNYLGKERTTAKDLLFCAEKFKEDPQICATMGAEGFPSLFPRPTCDDISKALRVSSLRTQYHDCPGLVENAGIVNGHRIVQHFEQSPLASDADNCVFETTFSYVDLTTRARASNQQVAEIEQSQAWPMVICHKDRVVGQDQCQSYIPGEHSSHEMAENTVVANAVRYLAGMPSNQECQFVDERAYNPLLLEYKSGCHIVLNTEQCKASYCPKKIFYDTREIKGIEYRGKPLFSYFPDSLSNPSYALSSIVENVYDQTPRSVRNFTELKFFLKNKEYIIHGIGCLEDILPEFFVKTSLNQCGPMPFIADGFIQEGEHSLVSLRVAIDDVHSPRLVKWSHIYNAVSSYQSIHPLKSWAMYVLR